MANTFVYGDSTSYGEPISYGENRAPALPSNLRTNPITNNSTPTFWWDSSSDPEDNSVHYELEISTTSSFDNILYGATNIPDRPNAVIQYTPTASLDLSFGIYYWRVRACDRYGCSAWTSQTQSDSFSYSTGQFVLELEYYSSPSPTVAQKIIGSVTEPGCIIEINGTKYGPFPTRNWFVDYTLTPGVNDLEIIAIDQSGRRSNTIEISIVYAYYVPTKNHVWNHYDELGALISLPRVVLPDIFKWKLMDRSDSVGHSIGTVLEEYIDIIIKQVPIQWDTLVWDESFFDVVGEDLEGYQHAPNIWDPKVEDLGPNRWKSGIGDGNDLFIRGLVIADV
jgi:hypothetical protein